MKAIDVTRGMLVLIDGKRARIGRTIHGGAGELVEVDFAPGLIKSALKRIPGDTEVFPVMLATNGTERVELDPVGEALSVSVKLGIATRNTTDVES